MASHNVWGSSDVLSYEGLQCGREENLAAVSRIRQIHWWNNDYFNNRRRRLKSSHPQSDACTTLLPQLRLLSNSPDCLLRGDLHCFVQSSCHIGPGSFEAQASESSKRWWNPTTTNSTLKPLTITTTEALTWILNWLICNYKKKLSFIVHSLKTSHQQNKANSRTDSVKLIE